MNRTTSAVLLAALPAFPAAGRAADAAFDASIVTAVDISDSIPTDDTRVELRHWPPRYVRPSSWPRPGGDRGGGSASRCSRGTMVRSTSFLGP